MRRLRLSAAIKELLKNLDDAQLDLGQAVYEEGLSGQDQSDLKTIVNTITELRDRLMKQKRGGKMAHEVDPNFEETLEIGEEIPANPHRGRMAEYIHEALVKYTEMPKGWRVLIPVGSDHWEVDESTSLGKEAPNAHPWDYDADFEVFGDDPDEVEFYGHAYGYGIYDAESETVILDLINVFNLEAGE